MWIKICGLTSADAVGAALEAGVQAIGFVFAPSVRRLDPGAAAQFARPARGRALCIAVTKHPSQAEIDDVLARFAPDALQADLNDFDSLRLPAALARLPVLRSGTNRGEWQDPLPARLLFEGPVSGAGEPGDWRQARALAGRCELVLAGGLRAENVAAAIRQVRPFGVDVSSGVEARPGMKSSARIEAFATAARAAFREMERCES
jgi:phosphoribosylanthranilate isomerase